MLLIEQVTRSLQQAKQQSKARKKRVGEVSKVVVDRDQEMMWFGGDLVSKDQTDSSSSYGIKSGGNFAFPNRFNNRNSNHTKSFNSDKDRSLADILADIETSPNVHKRQQPNNKPYQQSQSPKTTNNLNTRLNQDHLGPQSPSDRSLSTIQKSNNHQRILLNLNDQRNFSNENTKLRKVQNLNREGSQRSSHNTLIPLQSPPSKPNSTLNLNQYSSQSSIQRKVTLPTSLASKSTLPKVAAGSAAQLQFGRQNSKNSLYSQLGRKSSPLNSQNVTIDENEYASLIPPAKQARNNSNSIDRHSRGSSRIDRREDLPSTQNTSIALRNSQTTQNQMSIESVKVPESDQLSVLSSPKRLDTISLQSKAHETDNSIKQNFKVDLKKMKAAFAKELKMMIDGEIRKQQEERKVTEKLVKKTRRMVRNELEQQAAIEASKAARMTETARKLQSIRGGSSANDLISMGSSRTYGFGNNNNLDTSLNDSMSSTRTFLNKLQSANVLVDGMTTSRKTEQLLRLRAQNEEKAIRTMQLKELKDEEQKMRESKFEETMMSTQRKLISFQERKKVELQVKQENQQKKVEEAKKKLSDNEKVQQSKNFNVIVKTAQDNVKLQYLQQQKADQVERKALEKEFKIREARKKQFLKNQLEQQKRTNNIRVKEFKHAQIMKKKESQQELKKAKHELEREFERKKVLVLQKIKALKSQNKSIEEIYRYTNDIIFEEEDEGSEASEQDEDLFDKSSVEKEDVSQIMQDDQGNVSQDFYKNSPSIIQTDEAGPESRFSLTPIALQNENSTAQNTKQNEPASVISGVASEKGEIRPSRETIQNLNNSQIDADHSKDEQNEIEQKVETDKELLAKFKVQNQAKQKRLNSKGIKTALEIEKKVSNGTTKKKQRLFQINQNQVSEQPHNWDSIEDSNIKVSLPLGSKNHLNTSEKLQPTRSNQDYSLSNEKPPHHNSRPYEAETPNNSSQNQLNYKSDSQLQRERDDQRMRGANKRAKFGKNLVNLGAAKPPVQGVRRSSDLFGKSRKVIDGEVKYASQSDALDSASLESSNTFQRVDKQIRQRVPYTDAEMSEVASQNNQSVQHQQQQQHIDIAELQQRHASHMKQVLKEEEQREQNRQQLLERAQGNDGILQNLNAQFAKERQRAKEKLLNLMKKHKETESEVSVVQLKSVKSLRNQSQSDLSNSEIQIQRSGGSSLKAHSAQRLGVNRSVNGAYGNSSGVNRSTKIDSGTFDPIPERSQLYQNNQKRQRSSHLNLQQPRANSQVEGSSYGMRQSPSYSPHSSNAGLYSKVKTTFNGQKSAKSSFDRKNPAMFSSVDIVRAAREEQRQNSLENIHRRNVSGGRPQGSKPPQIPPRRFKDDYASSGHDQTDIVNYE